MKKKLIAFVSLIMALLVSVVSLGGCNLVTTNVEKDMQQTVATVSLENGVSDNVTKQELIMDYLNYGNYYVQYQGYTLEQAFDMIVENRVNTLLLYQNAMKQLDAKGEYADDKQNLSKWNPERYLEEEDIVEIKYEIYSSIEETLQVFADEEKKTTVKDTFTTTSRPTPANATNKEEEVDKGAFVTRVETTGFEVDGDYRTAFNKFINYLKNNNLLGSDYQAGKIATTDFYKKNYKSQMQTKVLEIYRELLTKEEQAKSQFGYDAMATLFEQEYAKQTEWSNAEFESALQSASFSSPMLFGKFGTYGYVYNLLLGVDTIQDTLVKQIDKSKTLEEQAELRKEILETTVATDLRGPWITSGYDYDATTQKFTGSYTFTSQENSLAYQGTSVCIKDKTEKAPAEYRVTPNTIDLASFIKGMDSYMVTGKFDVNYDNSAITNNASAYKTVNPVLNHSVYDAKTYGAVSEYDQKICELLFAFSTDDGSLSNIYKGYAIKPPVDTGAEQFVDTFGDAGRKLLEVGGNSYVVVASNYGYHIMFFSEVFSFDNQNNPTYDYNNDLERYLNDNYNLDTSKYASWEEYYNDMVANIDEWEEQNNYLYLLYKSKIAQQITSNVNRKEGQVINGFGDKIVIYEDRFSDLID